MMREIGTEGGAISKYANIGVLPLGSFQPIRQLFEEVF